MRLRDIVTATILGAAALGVGTHQRLKREEPLSVAELPAMEVHRSSAAPDSAWALAPQEQPLAPKDAYAPATPRAAKPVEHKEKAEPQRISYQPAANIPVLHLPEPEIKLAQTTRAQPYTPRAVDAQKRIEPEIALTQSNTTTLYEPEQVTLTPRIEEPEIRLASTRTRSTPIAQDVGTLPQSAAPAIRVAQTRIEERVAPLPARTTVRAARGERLATIETPRLELTPPAIDAITPPAPETYINTAPREADYTLEGIRVAAVRHEDPIPKTRLATLADRNPLKEFTLKHAEYSSPLPGLSSATQRHVPLGYNIFRQLGAGCGTQLLIQTESDLTYNSALPSHNLAFEPSTTDACSPAADLSLNLTTAIEEDVRVFLHPLHSALAAGKEGVGGLSLQYFHTPRFLEEKIPALDIFGTGPRAHAVLDLENGDDRLSAEVYATEHHTSYADQLGVDDQDETLKQHYAIVHLEDEHAYATGTWQRGRIHKRTIEDSIPTETDESITFASAEIGSHNEHGTAGVRVYSLERELPRDGVNFTGVQLSARYTFDLTETTSITGSGRLEMAGDEPYAGGHAEIAQQLGPVRLRAAVADVYDPLGPWRLGNSLAQITDHPSSEPQRTRFTSIGLEADLTNHRIRLEVEPTKHATAPWLGEGASISGRTASAIYSWAGEHDSFSLAAISRDLQLKREDITPVPGTADTELKAIYTHNAPGWAFAANLHHRIGNHFPLSSEEMLDLGTQTILNLSISKDLGPFTIAGSWINVPGPWDDNIVGAYKHYGDEEASYVTLPSVPGANLSVSFPH